MFKLKILSLKLSSISHSTKNLIYNSGTDVGVGMEGWEKMEEKEHLFSSKLGKWQNSQTHILINKKLHEMSFISNLNNETSYDKNSFPLPVIGLTYQL